MHPQGCCSPQAWVHEPPCSACLCWQQPSAACTYQTPVLGAASTASGRRQLSTASEVQKPAHARDSVLSKSSPPALVPVLPGACHMLQQRSRGAEVLGRQLLMTPALRRWQADSSWTAPAGNSWAGWALGASGASISTLRGTSTHTCCIASISVPAHVRVRVLDARAWGPGQVMACVRASGAALTCWYVPEISSWMHRSRCPRLPSTSALSSPHVTAMGGGRTPSADA